jgi:hypothetical protein
MSSFPPFAVAVSVLWVKLGINKELILDVRDTIAGPHNEHGCEAALTCISFISLHLQSIYLQHPQKIIFHRVLAYLFFVCPFVQLGQKRAINSINLTQKWTKCFHVNDINLPISATKN